MQQWFVYFNKKVAGMRYFNGTVIGSFEVATFFKPTFTLKPILLRNKYFCWTEKCLRATKFLDHHMSVFVTIYLLMVNTFFSKAAAWKKLLLQNSSETWQSLAQTKQKYLVLTATIKYPSVQNPNVLLSRVQLSKAQASRVQVSKVQAPRV